VFKKILIANRGEIAVRVIRTAREMDIATVAVYSDADRDALHVQMADEAFHIGPAAPVQSYLDSEKLLAVAARAGARAIHPGYGFLAENATFARAVVGAKFGWIGPHPDAIAAMGDKLEARRAMQHAGVPVVPGGTDAIADLSAAKAAAKAYGFPLALKAAGGGGGKGIKIAHSPDELESALTTAQREAAAYFKNGAIYAERYLVNPKHVELQIIADKHGNVVHAGERDCSLQRRHQKLWEETPAKISASVRDAMREAGLRAARAIGYDSAGTIECLVAGDEFFFLEMNTRIQVEHTVTEMVTGLDLVREQIRVAAGEPLGYTQDEVRSFGCAIEGRVNAEDPANNFRPMPGTITTYREPAGPGVRVDAAAYAGYTIPPDYDSLIAKLVVWAPSRERALARMRRAIDEYHIEGVPTTLPLLRALCDQPSVRDASYGTATLEAFVSEQYSGSSDGAATLSAKLDTGEEIRVEVNDKLFRVRLPDGPARGGTPLRIAPKVARQRHGSATGGNAVRSPMHGVVVELTVAAGDAVSEGRVVAVIEAMKMMNEIRAHQAGTVKAVHARPGDTVEANSPLLTIE
jgi:acetyl-CoA/propionyl-CoA/long-chain acyl-CoA carboxylase, biotin carboxylase, biotin carboxyl carrier protein